MNGCDFAVLTVVDEARDAAIELFGVTEDQWVEELGLKWGVALVKASDGGQHVVMVGKAVDRSNIPGNEAANAMLRAWRPRHLVVADIGGGFWGEQPEDRDGLDLGDVVVASDIEYFEVEKEVQGGRRESRSYPIQLPSPGPRDAFRSMHHWKGDWHELASPLRPKTGGPQRAPQVLDGQIVAGEKLLSDPDSELVRRLVATLRVPETLFGVLERVSAGSAGAYLMRLLAVSTSPRIGCVALPVSGRERGRDTRLASRTRGASPAGGPAVLPSSRSGVPGRIGPGASS